MDTFLGTIALFPYNYAPVNWAECDGALLSAPQNTPLYMLLGTRFGGDGQNTFALPDLRKQAPSPDVRYYIALQGLWPVKPPQQT